MSVSDSFVLGEFQRNLDERFRVSIPGELLESLGEGAECILAKERPGCLSIWRRETWQCRLDAEIALIHSKIKAGKLEGRLAEVQMLGRLLSTRHKLVQLAARGRLLLPEGFREFLRVEAGSEVTLVGAGVCVEIWQPQAWITYLDRRLPRFRKLLDALAE